jgi:dUTP pyrophosphatase
MLVVNFKKLHAEAKLPVKGSSSAACFDVYATSVEIDQNYIVTYGLGFATEIPEGWRGVIVPRSNISKHPWVLANSVGIIDSDYRGEWMVKFKAITDELALPYAVGERVAQVYFERVTDVTFAEVEELDQTERGAGGFGSTGLGEVKPNYVTNSTASIKSFNE